MFNSNLPESDLLKTVLEPLLEDFQYWFGRSRTLFESETIPFLKDEQQADILMRVTQAQKEVSTTQTLLKLTGGQVGVETSMLMTWHQLVTECWQVRMRLRSDKSV
ncbi:DUF2605 domain-containing protein [Phormidesmis priestleyi ULC007]|uniref:DUF2605 domain-containing protein n=1 Tax=Phormidesmis priestleyi ULC007 TaxID=1920490 RepID=A0A2T1DCE3_9CYAN|nr:DUF2605 domain-containing protein [Phormidesmis priestleyi]PSB18101.1 DUF2605 domain-containing protein [Phormidesmis priestleyi ULC007]PZO49628.1 MAG: DUF2605 domain-containing protein [Phormidesmis priestleyi]